MFPYLRNQQSRTNTFSKAQSRKWHNGKTIRKDEFECGYEVGLAGILILKKKLPMVAQVFPILSENV